MAFPRADLGVVDPVASGVTNPTLVSFRRFMRLLRALVFVVPIWFLITGVSPPGRQATPPPSPTATPSPSPSPTPTPVNAFLSLDVTMGDANTVINVTGGQFLPNEQTSLFWDTPNKVAGSATADGNGSFNTRVKPFAGDAPGVHKLCASVAPNPCANFALQGPQATPSPSPSPSESPSPSPTATAGATVTPTSSPVATTLNGFDVISKPPFVFLPLAGAFAIGLALVFWLFSVIRRPRQVALPSAAVVHRATRPDYRAGFGTPPPTPAAGPEPSAWPETPAWEARPVGPPPAAAPPAAPQPAVPQPAAAPSAEPQSEVSRVEWGAPVEWGTESKDWGIAEPPRVDEDLPEPPQPGD
jgi:hypothetical protein